MKKAKNPAAASRREYTRQLYHRNKLMYMISALCMVLFGASNLIFSWLLQKITDIVAGTETMTLAEIGIGTLVSIVVFALVYAVSAWTFPRFMQKALRQYKDYAFKKLTEKSISAFSRENTSKYISALTNDALSIETNYLAKSFNLPRMFVSFFGAIVMMIYYNPLLTAVAVGLSLFPVAASILAGNRLAKEEKTVSERNETFVGTIKDMLTGFPVIKSFKAEAAAQALFRRHNDSVEKAKRHRRSTEQTINLFSNTAATVAQLGVFFFGAYLALAKGSITPGVLIVFVQLMNFVIEPIGSLPPLLANRKAAWQLIDKLSESVSQQTRTGGKPIEKKLARGITVENLSFGYDEGKPVLHDVNLTFEAGKSYAIVGNSGSGKSTLLNLLMGSSNNYQGRILFDDHELRDIDSDSLYDLLTLVQQNVFVFNDTIKNNVTMFREFDNEKVAAALQKAHLTELIAAKGEDYVCGENGNLLSGGEKQRLSIARALLQETPVLLVDEATAALDANTAYEVSSAILSLDSVTRIVVTHRMEENLLKQYDRIYVLRSGRLAEAGTFKDLMSQKGLFYSLYTVSQG